MMKKAMTHYDIHPLLEKRWSPRAFSDEPVTTGQLQRLFEAVRWTPSSMNEQPWVFFVGIRGDETYEKIFRTLVAFNQEWAHLAPVLVLSCGRKVMNDKEEINTAYRYDTGQAVAHLTFQAMAEGLFVHQMGGFNESEAIALFQIPAKYKPLTVIAIGHIGDPDRLNQRLKNREMAARLRKPAEDFIFVRIFGEKSSLFRQTDL